MTLTVHHAPGTAVLAEGLAGLLAEPLDDPFDPEVVVTPTRGVERWLAQRLSHRLGVGAGGDGVCAGVRFVTPASLTTMLLDRERDDPWHPDRSVWPLLATIDDSLGEPWCATLATHLGHDLEGEAGELRRSRRWATAHRLARLFDSYAAQRPWLVADWLAGGEGDGAGGELDDDLAWQPELWRRLVTRVGAPPPDRRHRDTLERLAAGGPAVDALRLPGRLSLFGHTRMPVTQVELLGALGEHRDVHLWLPVASAALWESQRRSLATAVDPVRPTARADDRSADLVGHPLLASLGRDARELAAALARTPATAVADPAAPEPEPTTLLGRLQHDLRRNAAPDAAERAARVPAADDDSLQVHACHGASRQVDVLREVLTGLLEDHPDLEPRDVLVMCPDIETYAPLVSAAFGLGVSGGASGAGEDGRGAPHPAHRLRVRLADRSLASTNPLLALADRLLGLSGGRVSAVDVLDLLADDVVRRRFALADDDLERVQRWVDAAGVRWGIDAATRAPFAMEGFEHNTWRAGLDRVLLGVAMSGDEHRHLGRGLPLDDVGGGEVELAGRLAELVDRLEGVLDDLRAAGPVGEWTGALRRGVRALGDVEADRAWQWSQLDRELDRAAGAGAAGGADVDTGVPPGAITGGELRLADARAMLASRTAPRPTRANFRTGTLTVATMSPMRSVPHRVVCLLGLDDGVFPRASVADGDDVLARRPLVGERDPRSEDRQLLLDAVLAATEHLVVTYDGADEHTGARRPPAVPLGELLDAVDRTCAEPVRDTVLTRHPLQTYDARNLKAGPAEHDPPEWAAEGLVGPSRRPFGFDASALAGARALAGDRVAPPPMVVGPLPPEPGDGASSVAEEVSLDDLRRFLTRPVRTFLRDRLDVALPLAAEEQATAIPVVLEQLARWQVGDHLLTEMLAGADLEALFTAELLGGRIGPGQLGAAALQAVVADCQALWQGTAALREGGARAVDVDIDLDTGPGAPDLAGRRLVGTVTGVHDDRVVRLGYSRLKASARLGGWVDLLALAAHDVDVPWTSHVVGRGGSGARRARVESPRDEALGLLADLVRLRDVGMTRPMPLPVATGEAWAATERRRLRGERADPVTAAAQEWVTDAYGRSFPKEDADAAHVRLWGEGAPLQVLLDAGLPTAAMRLWGPLLEREEVRPL